jgi:hypothetical protein
MCLLARQADLRPRAGSLLDADRHPDRWPGQGPSASRSGSSRRATDSRTADSPPGLLAKASGRRCRRSLQQRVGRLGLDIARDETNRESGPGFERRSCGLSVSPHEAGEEHHGLVYRRVYPPQAGFDRSDRSAKRSGQTPSSGDEPPGRPIGSTSPVKCVPGTGPPRGLLHGTATMTDGQGS